MRRRFISLFSVIVLILSLFGNSALAAETRKISTPSGMTIKSQTDYAIVSGVTETHVKLTLNGEPLAAYITTVSADAEVTMKASFPGYYTAGSTPESRRANALNIPLANQRTTAQAAAYEAATGETVLFATNGSFFDGNNLPRGHLIIEGNLLQPGFCTVKEPYFAVLKDGSYDIRDYEEPFNDVSEAIAARHWLVRDGENVAPTEEYGDHTSLVTVQHPRTAIGLKSDGSLVSIVVDGRDDDYSVGVTLTELADIMIAAGCVAAVNLDGGGSSTFASRRNGTGSLTIRNQISDASERTVTSTLLLVSTADDCDHSYSSGTYEICADGTHDLICDLCGEAQKSDHRYTNGVCVCGDKETGTDSLYFDFTCTDADRDRYMTSAYGYYHFDTPTLGYWRRSYWATKAVSTTANVTNGFTLDADAGTLNVNVAAGLPYGDSSNYGPWITTTYNYRQYPTTSDTSTLPLSFDPSEVELIQVRFKVVGCEVTSTTDPRVVVVYDHTTGSSTKRGDYTMVESYTMEDGVYQTLNFTPSSTFKNADLIRSFGFRFWDLQSVDSGQVVIDYIYAGPERDAPNQKNMFFDFSDRSSDEERYLNKTYGGYNFDQAASGYWATMETSTTSSSVYSDYTIDNSAGTLSVEVADGLAYGNTNGKYGPWLTTTKYYGTYPARSNINQHPLSYDPSSAEVIQIRFKTVGCQKATGTNPQVVVVYDYLSGSSTTRGDYTMVSSYTLQDGVYQTLTIPVSDTFRNADLITTFGFRFWHIKGGSVVIDYIYVGTQEDLNRDRLYFEFDGDDTEQQRYASKTYGFADFSNENNWCMNSMSSTSVGSGLLSGTVTSTKSYIRTAADGTTNLIDCPLHYKPGKNDILQLRLRVTGSSVSSFGIRPYCYAAGDSSWTTSLPGASCTIADGEFVTVEIPLADTAFVEKEEILGLQLSFINLPDGKMEIDYIYVGPESDLPMSDHLFFDFTGTAEDLQRYSGKIYGGKNFDDADYWAHRGYTLNDAVISNGTLSSTLLTEASSAVDDYHSHYFETANQYLSYEPQSGDVLQMRLKVDNGDIYGSGNTFKVGALLHNGSKWSTLQYQAVPESCINNGYFIVTVPLSDDVTSNAVIKDLRLRFDYLLNADGKNAAITLDWAYVGPESTMPSAHSYQAVITAPTCTEKGYTTYTCSICGDSYTANETAALGHSYKSAVTAPTCTTGGYTTYTCSACGDSYKGSYTSSTGHDYDEGTVTKYPSRTATGVKTYTCQNDSSHTYTETLDKLHGHLFFDFTNSEEDQERYGNMVYTGVQYDLVSNWSYRTYTMSSPSISGGILSGTLLAEPDPDKTDYHSHYFETKKALYYVPAEGDHLQMKIKIDNAQRRYTDTDLRIGAIFHDGSNWSSDQMQNVSVDKIGQGYFIVTVALEDEVTAFEKITDLRLKFNNLLNADGTQASISVDWVYVGPESAMPTQHSYKAVVTAPTCTEKGYTTYTCSVCGDSYVANETAALGHNYKSVVTAPTCTTGGYTTYTCSACGDSYVANETAALGHNYKSVVTAPTCTTGGYTTYTCTNCGDSYTANETAALGHSYKSAVTAPTCTTGGYTTYTCTNCGDSYKGSFTSSTGHDYDEGTVTKYPSRTATGVKTYTCQNDSSHTYTETLDKLHDHLFFDFTNSEEDQERYGNMVYTGTQYDLVDNWSYRTYTMSSPSISGGILSGTLLSEPDPDKTDYHSHYFETKKALYYVPAEGDHLQMKIKIDNAQRRYTDTDLRIGAIFHDGSSWSSDQMQNVSVDKIGQGYFIVTVALEDEVTAFEKITNLRLKFNNLLNADGTQASISVDWVYVGAESTMPTQHSYKAVVTAPTCTEKGYTTYTCTNCGDSYVANETAALGHSYSYTNSGAVHTLTCDRCGDSYTEAHSYAEGVCVCGAKVESLLSFKSATVTLESDLSMNFYVAKTALEGFADPYVTFQKAIYDESGNVSHHEETNVTEYTEKTSADGTECYVFTFTGISAKEMSSAVSVILSGSYEGTVYSGNAVSYSVKQYAENLLAATEDGALRTLLVDMLNYGAEAQSYFAYNTANLANAGLTEEQKAWASQEELSLMSSLSVNDNEEQSVYFESAALLLEEKVTMNFYLDLDEYTGTMEDLYARVFFKNAKGDLVEYTIEGTELTELNGDHVLYFDGLNAAQMRSIIGVELYSRRTASCVSQTLYYSIESYAHNKLADASLAELVTAMMRYGDSVAAYAAQ